MEIQDCECYSKGLNYIVWRYSEAPKGVFIIHIGGPNKRELYRMMQELLQEEFGELDIFFCSQNDNYWKNHMVLDGKFQDGTLVYKYIRKDRNV